MRVTHEVEEEPELFYKFISVLAGLALIGCTGAASGTTAEDEAAILKIEAGMAASNSVADATVAWDKDVVLDDMLTIEPKVAQYVGIDAASAAWDKQFALFTYSVETQRIKVKTDRKLGFAWSTLHATAKSKSGGPPLDIVFRQATLYEKKDGQWKVVYINLSVPFDLKTGETVFDSKLPESVR